MRILLIAYEFPPSPSPQSLRWTYLVRELALAGHEVHVLTPHLGGEAEGLPELPAEVIVHRTYAGPVRGALAARRDRHLQLTGGRPQAIGEDPIAWQMSLQEFAAAGLGKLAPEELVALNAWLCTKAALGGGVARPSRYGWKHALSEFIQARATDVLFPDIRGEWLWPARRQLRRLLDKLQPDVAIASHEPATSLQLGVIARANGVPLLADLGDPVLAAYTPARWRRRALALERQLCAVADHISVTAPASAELLGERHGRREGISLLLQGFDDRAFDPRRATPHHGHPESPLQLLYTGSFYGFRRAETLLEAVRAVPGVRLGIATIVAPQSVRDACRESPEQFHLHGFLPHLLAMRMQRRADVLINIANAEAAQVPGKLLEYMGAGRPILHLRSSGADHGADLLTKTGGALVVGQDVSELTDSLRRLLAAKRSSTLDAQFPPRDAARIGEYGWSRIAARLEAILAGIAKR
ncbi:MAG TPA: glycosyltransferase [Xanthomonadaceae bacterium]|nr:glycosyltransferase [Xanthomonadaceae bacterium]